MFLIQRARIRAALAEGRLSVVSLLLVNLLPLVGVVFFGWSTFDVVFLYWSENVVIGVLNVLKILTCWPDADAITAAWEKHLDDQQRKELSKISSGGMASVQASKLFFAPFFAVHYGGFCVGHGLFVCVLLGRDGPMGGLAMHPFEPALEALARPEILVALFALAASHVVSYFTNYLGRGEYRESTPMTLMVKPYGRVIVLHIAIISGGFLIMMLGSPVWMLAMLVIGKTMLDLSLHLREHQHHPNPPTEPILTTA